MRSAAVVCGAVLLVLAAGCADEDREPSPSTSPSEPTAETTEPSQEPFDPTSVDLGEQQWQFASVYNAPVEVDLSGGEGTGEFGQWEGRFELGEDDPISVDMDSDGDQRISLEEFARYMSQNRG